MADARRNFVAAFHFMPGHGVVDHHHLFRRHAVAFDDGLAGQAAHGHHQVGGQQARALDGRHLLIDVFAAAVVFRGVNVGHQGFAGQGLGQHARRIGHPVMDVDHVVAFAHGDGRGQTAEAAYFAHQVRAVAALELKGEGRAGPSAQIRAAGRAGQPVQGFGVALRGDIWGKRAGHGHETDVVLPDVLSGTGHALRRLFADGRARGRLQPQETVPPARADTR